MGGFRHIITRPAHFLKRKGEKNMQEALAAALGFLEQLGVLGMIKAMVLVGLAVTLYNRFFGR